MKWLYLSASTMALATALLFSGCGADSNEACAYKVEQDLDHGDYDAVIASLENNGTCNGALTQNDAWTNLAGAYMGKAGITINALAGTVLNNTAADPMAAFLEVFGALATTQGIQNMSSAAKVYGYIRKAEGFPDCNTLTGASVAVIDSCFYEELTNTIQTVSIMSAVMGDALTFLTTPVVGGSIDDVNDNNTSDELEVTGCAIALATTQGPSDCVAAPIPSASVAFIDEANVTFSNGTVLIPRTFTVTDSTVGPLYGNQTYYRMMDTLSPVTTSGACDANYVACTPIDNTSCYPCPIVVDGATLSSTTVVLDSINNGTITGVTSNDMEQACIDAETAKNITPHVCVLDNNFTDVELAQFMSLL